MILKKAPNTRKVLTTPKDTAFSKDEDETK